MREHKSDSALIAQILSRRAEDSPAVLIASAIALVFGLFSLGRALLGI